MQLHLLNVSTKGIRTIVTSCMTAIDIITYLHLMENQPWSTVVMQESNINNYFITHKEVTSNGLGASNVHILTTPPCIIVSAHHNCHDTERSHSCFPNGCNTLYREKYCIAIALAMTMQLLWRPRNSFRIQLIQSFTSQTII